MLGGPTGGCVVRSGGLPRSQEKEGVSCCVRAAGAECEFLRVSLNRDRRQPCILLRPRLPFRAYEVVKNERLRGHPAVSSMIDVNEVLTFSRSMSPAPLRRSP